MWKLVIAMVEEVMYSSLKSGTVIADERKHCKCCSQGTKNKFIIYKCIVKDLRKNEKIGYGANRLQEQI